MDDLPDPRNYLSDEEKESRVQAINGLCKRFGWSKRNRQVLEKGLYDYGHLHNDWFALLAKADSIQIPECCLELLNIANQLSSSTCKDICDILTLFAANAQLPSSFNAEDNDVLMNALSREMLDAYFRDKPRRINKNTVIAGFVHRTNCSHLYDLDIWVLQNVRNLKGTLGDTIASLRREIQVQKTMDEHTIGRVSDQFLTHMDTVFACIEASNGRVTEQNIQNADIVNYENPHDTPVDFYSPNHDIAVYNGTNITQEEWSNMLRQMGENDEKK